jgi:farnesyl diphosphate synthase
LRIALVSALARASGFGGMAGGQMLDLAAEGRFGKVQHGEKEVFQLQAMKTGALLHFGCVAGAILGKASPAQHDALSRYGKALGTAFQIADDLLDLEGDAATVGKAVGKDAAAGKATFISILGPDGARRRLRELVAEADSALSTFGNRAEILRQTARFVAERRN